jgi:hypothetical protein
MDSAGVGGAASLVVGIIRDGTGMQLIAKTLDRLNTSRGLSGPQVDADYQFRKDVLGAAGIGNRLDIVA